MLANLNIKLKAMVYKLGMSYLCMTLHSRLVTYSYKHNAKQNTIAHKQKQINAQVSHEGQNNLLINSMVP